ncbi:hypothetical protein P9705_001238 [Enterococcus faecalis]|nr:hypothetical protein [Enterococcus faecalis]
MTTTELAKQIRKELKEKGITSRKVSVKSEYVGYSSKITVTVKDLNISIKEVEKIAKKHQSIRYDEVTGETLQGANTYVNVKYDFDLYEDAVDERIESAAVIQSKLEGKPDGVGEIILEDEKWEVNAFAESRGYEPMIIIVLKDKEENRLTQKRFTCFSKWDIASFLVEYDYQINKKTA